MAQEAKRDQVDLLGEEWSDQTSLDQVFELFMQEHLQNHTMEIGVGGGRVAKKVREVMSCGKLTLVDISKEMLKVAESNIGGPTQDLEIEFVHNPLSPDLPQQLKDTQFDFIYCFDVLVHCDLHTVYKTLANLHPLLKDGSKLFISLADVTSDLGFQRFKNQKQFKVSGFCFMSPDMALKIVDEAGYKIVKSNLKGHESCI